MAEQTQATAGDELGRKLNEMLSDPDTMQRLAGMASAFASSGLLSGTDGGECVQRFDAEQAPSESADAGEAGAGNAHTGALRAVGGSRHTELLRAVKPYLGAEKQARVDRLMKLLQLAELADTVLRGSGGL